MSRFLTALLVGLILPSVGCVGFYVEAPFFRTYGPSYLRGKTMVIMNSVSPDVILRVEVDGMEWCPHGWKISERGAFQIAYGQSFPVIVESYFYDRGSDRSIIVKGVDKKGGLAGFQERTVFADPHDPRSENWVITELRTN